MNPARLARRGVVAALLAVSLLPIANWIGSDRQVPWYGNALQGWLVGTAGVTILALLLAVISRRSPALWREGALAEALRHLDPARPRVALALGAFAALVYLAAATLIFERRPTLIDELVLLFQGRTYATGRLFLPLDPDPAFRSVLNVVEHQGKWFGHFPPGWPLLLAAGEKLGAPWVAGPAAGGVMVWAFGRLVTRAEPVPSVRAGAVLLLALAPFPALMAGSAMNHTATVMWLLLAVVGWLRWLERSERAALLGVGFSLGMAAITRPADAVAFGFPAACWVVVVLLRRRELRPALWMAGAALVPVGFMLGVNQLTTGRAFLSGYELLWGSNVGLGFHPAPYGPDHTPLRGLELISLYLLRLNRYLFEAPLPSLLPAALALWLVPSIRTVDRFLLAAASGVLVLYFAYWHDGFFLGPRFLYPLAPVVALWTARLPRMAATVGGGLGQRVAGYALALAAASAVASGIPRQAGLVAASQPALRFDADRAAAGAGIRNAVVFVRESFGSELLARLAALGADRPTAERFYHGIDSCVLDGALLDAETNPDGRSLAERLGPLIGDSARLVASPFSADTSERVLNGATYGPRCRSRIAAARQGTVLLAPTLLSRRNDLLFVRDLHERNGRVLAREPNRAIFLLARVAPDSAPAFFPLSRDSLLGLGR